MFSTRPRRPVVLETELSWMMTGSPSDVTPGQLDELGIALKKV